AKLARKQVQIFKPSIDKRYDAQHVVSHDANAIYSTPVKKASEILDKIFEDCSVVGIDEVQFFDEEILSVCNILANRGIRVIVAGLDMDYMGKPFGYMPELLAIAEYVTKTQAICMRCGAAANYSYRKAASEETVLLGETDLYEARCRKCFFESKIALQRL
ncbi:MAG: thymidine kinase, partial [Raineya sp.]|nr:thymidine kinase [Raineya sp.]